MAATIAACLVLAGPGAAQVETRQTPLSRTEMQLSFAPLVRKTAPAVVNIYTRRSVATGPALLFNDPFFRRFFGDLPAPEGRRRQIQNSLGSGVIVDPTGLIVTNAHVIEGADEITVVLADRREFEAEVLRADAQSDLALLRVATGGQRLPTLRLGDSDAIETGDLVLAIGNPFGVGQTVTSGIVSAVARSGLTESGLFIQTDAAINPGNSGGALVNMAGELIGVNTAIYSRSGGSHGVGFAIPSNLIRSMLAGGASASGRIVRPWLGGEGQAVTQDIAYSLGMDRPYGVLLSDVYKGGPLDRAGLRPGDVVLSVHGHEVDDPAALRFRVSTEPLGSAVELRFWRQNRERATTLAIEPPPESPPRDTTRLGGRNPLAGATVANLSPALIEELSLDGPRSGVVVTEIEPRSVAARLGFRPGDIIVSVNGREIRRVADLRSLLSAQSSPWQLAVRRDGRLLSLSVG